MEKLEYWDALDCERRPLGHLLSRREKVPAGEYHTVIHVWVKCGERILLTLRHPDKPFGLTWECTGGSVLAGETSVQGAARELFEETGILTETERLVLADSYIGRSFFNDTYILTLPPPFPATTMQEGETIAAKWVARDEFERMEGVAEPVKWLYSQIAEKLWGSDKDGRCKQQLPQ